MLRLCRCLRLLCVRMRDCLVWALSLAVSMLMLTLAAICASGLLGLVRRRQRLLRVSGHQLARRPFPCRQALRSQLRLWGSLDSLHPRVLLAWLLLSCDQALSSLPGLSASCLQLSLLVSSWAACWLHIGLGHSARSR